METATAVIEEVKPNADVELPSLAEYESKALVLRQRVDLVKIETDDQYRDVAAVAVECAENIKSMKAELEPHRVKRYNSLQRIYDILTAKVKPLEETKTKAARLTALYNAEQEQKRQAEEDRLRREEQERAQKLQAQQAEQLASEGRVEEGVAVLESQPEVMPVVAPVTVPKVAGISGKVTWVYTAEVFDLMALVKAVAEGKAPIQALGSQDRITKVWDVTTGQDFLNSQADAFKEAFSYPGCRVKKDVRNSSVRTPRR